MSSSQAASRACARRSTADHRAGRSLGFTFFQLNTNGLRLARDPDYLRRLVDAGLSTVFLQFDGLRDPIHVRLRGRVLADKKRAAIANCSELGVGVVLVPTLVPGVNVDDIGAIIEFALQYAPTVRGVHFQPISYFGRYPAAPLDSDRITIPEVIRAIEAEMRGAIRRDSFGPPGGEKRAVLVSRELRDDAGRQACPVDVACTVRAVAAHRSRPEKALSSPASLSLCIGLRRCNQPQNPTRPMKSPSSPAWACGTRFWRAPQDPHLLYLGYGVPGRLDIGSGPPAGLLHPRGERS